MANFNTYQTRNLYVVKDFLASGEPDAAGELAMGTTATGEIFFKYFNGDGLATRTDLIRPDSIVSLKKTAAADMNTPLPAYALTVDTDAVTLSNCVGKVFTLTINLHEMLSYDMNDYMSVTASLVGTSTNTANAAAFLNAFAKEIINVMPKFTKKAPFKVYVVKSSSATEVTKTSSDLASATGIVIVPQPCDYRRGVLSKDIFTLSYTSRLHGEDVAWAKALLNGSSKEMNTVADVNTGLSTSISPANIPSVYAIADLEYFTFGERGDDKRLFNWPHNYDPTYLVDLSKVYDVVTIEFYWNGSAENVQKSPRMIQFACEGASGSAATSLAGSIYDAVAAAQAGVASS